MRFIELFAGIGGFRLALAREGHMCVWANEWLKQPRRIYASNFGDYPDDRDIRTIESNEIPDCDLLTAGFPCATFSVAGKRTGFSMEDARGTLFFEVCRVLRDKRIPFVLLENVKGLLNHDNGRTFAVMLSSLDELGYDAQWELLNCQHFGLPQARERVFIVGHLRGRPRPEVFPLERRVPPDPRERDPRYQRLFSKVELTPRVLGMLQQVARKRTHDTPVEINNYLRKHKKGWTNKKLAEELGIPVTQVEHYFRRDTSRAIPSPEIWSRMKELLGFDDMYDATVTDYYEKEVTYEHNRRVWDTTVAPTLTASHVPIIGQRVYKGGQAKIHDVRGVSQTLTAGGSGSGGGLSNVPHILVEQLEETDSLILRRLTPLECERLQGLPDYFTAYYDDGSSVKDTIRYERCGRTVPIPIVMEIGRKLYEYEINIKLEGRRADGTTSVY